MIERLLGRMLQVALAAFVLYGGIRTHGCLEPREPADTASSVQAEFGPGGRDYLHADVVQHAYGQGDTQFWIFEPASPTRASAPLVVFLHGWAAMSPRTYGAWIRHLVRRGNVVVYPRYQASLTTRMPKFTPNSIAAIRAALVELSGGSHVRPELDHVAFVGHSMGGAIAANVAALAAASGLPQPGAIMAVMPGVSVKGKPEIAMPLEDLSGIPASTLALVVVGDADKVVGEDTAKQIFHGLTQVGAADKNYVRLISDRHGRPPLVAGHLAGVGGDSTIGEAKVEQAEGGGGVGARLRQRLKERLGNATFTGVDALDTYGLWKLLDGLCDAAFYGQNRQFALGNTPEQRFMGNWQDGTPIRKLVVVEQP